jgi:hypothetical protein
MGPPEIEDNGIAFAINEAAVLPKLEQACAVGSRTKKCARGRNCFVFIGCVEFCSPNDLAVPVEQVTAIFERPCWRPQREYLVQERQAPGSQRDHSKAAATSMANTLAHVSDFSGLCCCQVTRAANELLNRVGAPFKVGLKPCIMAHSSSFTFGRSGCARFSPNLDRLIWLLVVGRREPRRAPRKKSPAEAGL